MFAALKLLEYWRSCRLRNLRYRAMCLDKDCTVNRSHECNTGRNYRLRKNDFISKSDVYPFGIVHDFTYIGY